MALDAPLMAATAADQEVAVSAAAVAVATVAPGLEADEAGYRLAALAAMAAT